jgi:hypothetical protein
MAWMRYHYHCEQCDGSWLVEAEVEIVAQVEAVADCKFCGTRDVFSYRSDAGRISRATLAVVAGTKKAAKTPLRAGRLKRSA